MSYQYFSQSDINNANRLLEPQLQEVNEQIFLDSPQSNHDVDLSLAHERSSHYSPGEAFTYKAELVNAYQEKGRIDLSDTWNAQQKAELYGYQSDASLEEAFTNSEESEAYNHIKESILLKNYNNHGYLDHMAASEAEMNATLRAPLEQSNFDSANLNHLTPGGELIRDAELSQIYTENGNWTMSDIYNSEIQGYMHGPEIDYLL